MRAALRRAASRARLAQPALARRCASRPAVPPTGPLAALSPLRPILEPARAAANALLRRAGAPVQLTLEMSGDALDAEAVSSAVRSPSPCVVPREAIEAYVDSVPPHSSEPAAAVGARWSSRPAATQVLETDALVNHPLIPDALERRLYILVVRVVLRVLSDAIGTLDGRALLGRMLAVTQARAAARTEPRALPSEMGRTRQAPSVSSPLARGPFELRPSLIAEIARRTSGHAAAPLVTRKVDQLIYANVVQFALRLGADMLHSSRLTVLGVTLQARLTWDETDAASCATPQGRAAADGAGGAELAPLLDDAHLEAIAGPMVDALLADEAIATSVIPDALEREAYMSVVRLLGYVAAAAADGAHLDCFGVGAAAELR